MKSPTLLIGAAIVGIGALGIWAWTPDRSRSELDSLYLDASTRYRDVAGTVLRVRESGLSGAPALIFLHGFASSLETWEPWAQSLNSIFRVVRFDFPGSGLSPPDPTGHYDDARTLEIVYALMDQLKIDSAVFIGNSMGGRIAWKFTAASPNRVRKLVLISPDGFASPGFAYGKPPKVPRTLSLMKYFLPKVLLRKNLAAAYADPSRLLDRQVDRYYDLLLAPGNRGAMIERMQQTVLEDPEPLLRQIQVPTLLLWGAQDHLIPFSNSADYLHALAHATLVSFADLGHVPHEESPAESLKPLLAFLSQ
jgi:pimeloyl-ACP methyl ester carboxylesterase